MKIFISNSSPMYYEPLHEFSEDTSFLKNALAECERYKTGTLSIEGTSYNTSDFDSPHLSLPKQHVIWKSVKGELVFYLRYEILSVNNKHIVNSNLVFSKIGNAINVYRYLIDNHEGLLSSHVHTKKGMAFWKKLVSNIGSQYEAKRIVNNKIEDIKNIDEEWTKLKQLSPTRILLVKK